MPLTGKEKKARWFHCYSSRLYCLRVSIVVCLIFTTIIVGYGSYALMYNFEGRLQSSQYSSLAKQLQASSEDSVYAKVLALKSVAALLSMECPYVSNWPNCSISPFDSYLNLSDPVIEMAKMRTIAFAPIISSDQVAEFEAHAYNFFEEQGYPGLGVSSFGKGISSVNSTTENRVHDTEGYQDGGHKILTPVLQIGNLETNRPAVMFNLYSQEYRVAAIDYMIDCFESGADAESCTSITDIIFLVQDPVFRPAVLIIHPVTPYYNKSNLAGLVYTVHNWDTVLSNSIPDYASGIDVILCGGDETYTFRIDKGVAALLGVGDLHDSKYNGDRKEFTFDFFGGSVVYSITIYPTDEYEDQFRTDGPYIIMGLSLFIILFTSSIFFCYDYFMNRSALERELVIETKRLFVRFISHEIRTPMNTVHLGLKLLAREITECIQGRLANEASELASYITKLLKEWCTLIDDVEESTGTAVLVLNDLINYDKISMGTLTTELQLVDLWQLIDATVRPFYVHARQSDVSLIENMEITRLDVTTERRTKLRRLRGVCDDIKISQVIRNLVSNALKFSPAGCEVLVTVDWVENGMQDITLPVAKEEENGEPGDAAWINLPRAGSLLITVQDTGAGMSAKDQENLFKEGIQFHANQLQHGQGSGLGLWISKGVVELHNGHLSATSDGVGKGSTFRCELPLVLADLPLPTDELKSSGYKTDSESTTASDKVNSVRAVSVSIPETQKVFRRQDGDYIQRVLVVEDSLPSRKVLCRLLRNAGYTALEAVDGLDCVHKMRDVLVGDDAVQLVLSDFDMPRMNGPDATKALREMGCTIPIVGVTGNVLPADQKLFIDSGADSVLRKPISLELLESVFNHCNENRGSIKYKLVDNEEVQASLSSNHEHRLSSLPHVSPRVKVEVSEVDSVSGIEAV